MYIVLQGMALDHSTILFYQPPGYVITSVVGATFTSSEPRALRLPTSATYEEVRHLISERIGPQLLSANEIPVIIYRAPLSIHPLMYGGFLLEDNDSVQIMMYAHQRSQLNFIELFVYKVDVLGDLGDLLKDVGLLGDAPAGHLGDNGYSGYANGDAME